MISREQLKNGRILVTNDDGIHGHGLKVLETIARQLCDDVWVVAPDVEQSAASHSLTINRPVRLRQLEEKRFTLDGTPTDCVLLAVNHILKDQKPTLVLSGVNQGANIGEDITYSGTIAAAMEATLLNVPAIALSQHYEDRAHIDWSAAEQHGADVIARAATQGWPANVLLNINFPSRPASEVTGIQVVRHGKRKIGDELLERVDPRGRPYFWIGAVRGEAEIAEDTDIHVVFSGGISVTPIYLDLTHRDSLATLRQAFM